MFKKKKRFYILQREFVNFVRNYIGTELYTVLVKLVLHNIYFTVIAR